MKTTLTLLALVAGTAATGQALAANSPARPSGYIDQLEITQTADAFGGATPAGAAGPYQLISGVVHGKLNPLHPDNASITDLDKAPRDAHGYVSYTTDFVILRPKSATQARRALFYDVANRGRKLAEEFFIGGKSLRNGPAPGDTYPSLLRAGYTIVWSGWQGDLKQSGAAIDGALGTQFPVVTNKDGSAITGLSREEYIPDFHQGHNEFKLSYAPASLRDKSQVSFTVRQTWRNAQGQQDYQAPSAPVTDWHYEPKADGSVNVVFTPPAAVPGPAGGNVPADQGSIYSFVYPATHPKVMAIGFAAVRDLVSFLRDAPADASGTANPLNDMKNAACVDQQSCTARAKRNVDLTIGEGISQSGRFMRDFLYMGFNKNAQGNKVFDGMMAIIPGGRRTWINERFSQPGRWSKGHEEHWMPGDQFPFAYNVMKDPVSGVTDGLLKRCTASATCPKIMQIDGSFEWWGGRGALVVTDGAGKDLVLPGNVRYYLISGTQHAGGAGIRNGVVKRNGKDSMCQFPASPVTQAPVLRAMIPAMESWLAKDQLPPPSRYPTVASGTAVTPDQASIGFPALDNVLVPLADSSGTVTPTPLQLAYSGIHNPLAVTDYRNAIPVVDVTRPYRILVPKVDADGNELGGIAQPEVAVPLATYTGWNLRAGGHAQGETCSSLGSAIPFAVSGASRSSSDPRPALDQRYHGRADYAAQIKVAGDKLVQEGYLLPLDAEHLFAAHAQQVSPQLIPQP
ncbi:peptidase [Herbaspirillum huttiense]|uniref:alpha/beta hydrolase domain-containing protein n=1 Tax=Herbaspirillum huttiense TaxID=863372 RepID=UPI0010649502|nr:alpha/beta hydrolase domain-containing protein [Herbaspirillum huttiense]QBP76247.1 peptidase [Herbaspirillum huttiense]